MSQPWSIVIEKKVGWHVHNRQKKKKLQPSHSTTYSYMPPTITAQKKCAKTRNWPHMLNIKKLIKTKELIRVSKQKVSTSHNLMAFHVKGIGVHSLCA